jgi:hypothetical protein
VVKGGGIRESLSPCEACNIYLCFLGCDTLFGVGLPSLATMLLVQFCSALLAGMLGVLTLPLDQRCKSP